MKRASCILRDLTATLGPILDELMASDLERHLFVIVEDTVTKRFVQFARRYKPKTGELLFDVPALNVVLEPCPDTKTGAEWAANTLTLMFELPVSAPLIITCDGDPAN